VSPVTVAVSSRKQACAAEGQALASTLIDLDIDLAGAQPGEGSCSQGSTPIICARLRSSAS